VLKPNPADRKWPADGVVAICAAGGPASVRGHRHQRLRGRPIAAFITGKPLSEPMLRKFSKF